MLIRNYEVCKLIIIFELFLAVGCGTKEEISPLFQPEKLQFKAIELKLHTSIGHTVIAASGIKKILYPIKWIPFIPDLLELPINLTAALLPPLNFQDGKELPSDVPWNDPRVLPAIKSVKVSSAQIRVTPPAERIPSFFDDTCWFFWKCPGDLTFIQKLDIYLLFKKEKIVNDDDVAVRHFASAELATNYNFETKILNFNLDDINLRGLFESYPIFEVRVFGKGHPPPYSTYIDGSVSLDFVVELPTPY